jgi:hypothetical protein
VFVIEEHLRDGLPAAAFDQFLLEGTILRYIDFLVINSVLVEYGFGAVAPGAGLGGVDCVHVGSPVLGKGDWLAFPASGNECLSPLYLRFLGIERGH